MTEYFEITLTPHTDGRLFENRLYAMGVASAVEVTGRKSMKVETATPSMTQRLVDFLTRSSGPDNARVIAFKKKPEP